MRLDASIETDGPSDPLIPTMEYPSLPLIPPLSPLAEGLRGVMGCIGWDRGRGAGMGREGKDVRTVTSLASAIRKHTLVSADIIVRT